MKLFIAVLSLIVSTFALAAVKLVTTSTDLAWAAREIAKDKAEVTSLLRGSENPHYVDAVPDFIRLVADAQVVCSVGLDLEVGWLPKVVAKSGNAAVQPAGQGYCETGKSVEVLEKPVGKIDRSMGDVHPSGNPHFWTSPTHLAQASRTIRDTLIAIDPTHRAFYEKNASALEAHLKKLAAEQKARFTRLKFKGPVIMEYHKEFTYLLTAYGIPSYGSLEDKPGVPPSAGRIAEVALGAKAAGIKLLLAAEGSPRKTLQRFTELSGIPVLSLPVSLKAQDGKGDYIESHIKSVSQIFQFLEGEAGGKKETGPVGTSPESRDKERV